MLEEICRWFLLFLLYSGIGWAAETVYCSVPKGHFVQRGFLHGPLCPIYGTGALLVLFLLTPFFRHPALVFLLGTVITSALEYLTSFLMERLFHTRWWDYSGRRWNLHGRICLRNSLLFGVMCLVLTEWIHPFFQRQVSRLPAAALLSLSGVLLALFAADTALSVLSAIHLGRRLQALRLQALQRTDLLRDDLKERREDLEQAMRARRAAIQERTDTLREQFDLGLADLRRRLSAHGLQNASLRRMIRAFPAVEGFRPAAFHEELKRRLRRRRKGKR